MKFLIRYFSRLAEDELVIRSSAVALQLILSLIPGILFFSWFLAEVGIRPDTPFTGVWVQGLIPDSLIPLTASVLSLLENSGNPAGWAFTGLGLAAWSGASGFSAIIRGLLMAYRVKTIPNFILLRFRGLVLLLSFGLMLVVIYSLISGSFSYVFPAVGTVFNFRIQPVLSAFSAFLLTFSSALFLYLFGPSGNLPLKAVLPGSLLFSAGWITGSYALTSSLDVLENFRQTVHFLGSGILLLVWVWGTAFLLLAGGELNAVLHPLKGQSGRRKKVKI